LGFGYSDEPDRLDEMTIDEFNLSDIYDEGEPDLRDPGPDRIAIALEAWGNAIISYASEGQWFSPETMRIHLGFIADYDTELAMHSPELVGAAEIHAD
jgi:hypothetical protein